MYKSQALIVPDLSIMSLVGGLEKDKLPHSPGSLSGPSFEVSILLDILR